MGQVYCLTFPSGRQYIGITMGTAEARFKGHVRHAVQDHGRPVCRAFRKYGAENVKMEVLADSDSWECLCKLEIEMIEKYGTLAPKGYNRTLGGEGASGLAVSDETREKISSSSIRAWSNAEYRAEQSQRMKDFWKNPENRARMVEKLKIRSQDPEYREKLRRRPTRKNFGKVEWTEEMREFSANRMKGNSFAKGHRHTDETKARIAAGHIGKKKSPEAIENMKAAQQKRHREKRNQRNGDGNS